MFRRKQKSGYQIDGDLHLFSKQNTSWGRLTTCVKDFDEHSNGYSNGDQRGVRFFF